MGDYKTTRLLVYCALDRIWSSTQRLEDLDWFGPEMPYVQYGGGGVLALLLSSLGCSKFREELTSWSSSVEPLGVQPFPMWGAFPFIVQGGAPIYIYLALSLGTVGVPFVLVSRRDPLGRSGVGRLDPDDLLGQRVILAIFLGNELSTVLSHPGSVGAARSLRWSFGGHLRSCPSGPMFLISRATLCFPCVAPASGAAHPVRGALPRSGRGRLVMLAGVIRWCTEAIIITAGEATSC